MGKFYEGLGEELSLIARSLGWLHATTREKDGKKSTKSRGELLPEFPRLPEARAAYLIGYLFDAGPVHDSSSGRAALSWADLREWQQQTGIELKVWEARTLRAISLAYLAEMQQAEDPERRAPWLPELTDTQKATDRLKQHLRGLVNL